MRPATRRGDQGCTNGTPGNLIDVAAEASVLRGEHTRLVETLMQVIDLFDGAQSDGARVDVPVLRKRLGPLMRRSAASHSLAVAAVVVDVDPKLADELCEYADEVLPDEGGGAVAA